MNSLVHVTVRTTLLSIVYQDASTRRHVDIIECPCNELANHERVRYGRREKEMWRQVGPETTFYYIRLSDEAAMYREHLVGAIRELGSEEGGKGVDDNLEDCIKELKSSENDWVGGKR